LGGATWSDVLRAVFDDGEQVVGSCYEGHADKFRAEINPDFFRCCTFWAVSLYRSV
jgi:hypothetical protein